MCIISANVNYVGKTNIYVSINQYGTRQLTVYSNRVESPTHNAMILPVPKPESVKFVDLSSYADLFDDCERCFSKISMTRAYLTASSDTLSYIPVVEVGSYIASVVPSISDFDRLNMNVFRFSPDLLELLTKYYSNGYGFIVCQLRPGNHTYHPFGYTHDLAENGSLFIPTRHYHPDGLQYKKMRDDSEVDDWDHVIYSAVTDLDSQYMDRSRFINTKGIHWNKLPKDYRWASNAILCRWSKTGKWKNKDLWAKSFHDKPTEFISLWRSSMKT